MPDSLVHLLALAPDWAMLIGRGETSARWLAAPLLPSGDRVPAFFLRIWDEGGLLAVAEAVPGTRLPIVCPELHIPEEGAFCLARGYHPVASPSAVADFWQVLGEYLVNQHFAARRRRWPAGRWLSHGPKAVTAQFAAERAARSAGLAEDYSLYLENGEGWIGQAVDARAPRRGDPCPRGCSSDSGGVTSFGRCPHRRVILKVLSAERERQRSERIYFDAMRCSGVTCCGRIDGCPLMAEKEAA